MSSALGGWTSGASPTGFLPLLARATAFSSSSMVHRPSATGWRGLMLVVFQCVRSRTAWMVGTTKPTIHAVRDRTHWNTTNIKPRHPVALGLCTMEELEKAVARANKGKKPVGDAPLVQPPSAEDIAAAAEEPAA